MFRNQRIKKKSNKSPGKAVHGSKQRPLARSLEELELRKLNGYGPFLRSRDLVPTSSTASTFHEWLLQAFSFSVHTCSRTHTHTHTHVHTHTHTCTVWCVCVCVCMSIIYVHFWRLQPPFSFSCSLGPHPILLESGDVNNMLIFIICRGETAAYLAYLSVCRCNSPPSPTASASRYG